MARNETARTLAVVLVFSLVFGAAFGAWFSLDRTIHKSFKVLEAPTSRHSLRAVGAIGGLPETSLRACGLDATSIH